MPGEPGGEQAGEPGADGNPDAGNRGESGSPGDPGAAGSGQLPDIGAGGLPGSSNAGAGQPGEEHGGEPGNAGDSNENGGSGQSGSSGVPAGGQDGTGSGSDWESSNQLPEVPVDITAKGDGSGAQPDGVPGKSGSGAAGDLEDALKDLDGGIMAERSAIRAKAAETPNPGGGASRGSSGVPRPGDSDGASGVAGTGGNTTSPSGMALPDGPSAVSKAPSPPARSGIPKDVDDARDDDVIARQLREAAMAETDPAVREKLWADYQKYKRR
jgi:hypothetical protein